MECHYLDFLVDGASLLGRLAQDDPNRDFVSCFTAEFPDLSAESRDCLLRNRDFSGLEPGRVPLYVCPECAAIGCGAYTVCVTRQEGGYLWSDFAYENGYDDARPCENIWSFFFEKREYEEFMRLAVFF